MDTEVYYQRNDGAVFTIHDVYTYNEKPVDAKKFLRYVREELPKKNIPIYFEDFES